MQSLRRLGTYARETGPGRREPRHGARQSAKRQREIRCRASIDGKAGRGLVRQLLERHPHGLLHRVAWVHVFRTTAQMPGHGQESAMLARAIVVGLVRTPACPAQCVTSGGACRRMDTATQVRLGQADLGQPLGGKPGMDLVTAVGGASQRQMPVREPCRVRRPALHQRQRLEHLAGRARQNHPARVAPSLDHRAIGRGDDRSATMD